MTRYIPPLRGSRTAGKRTPKMKRHDIRTSEAKHRWPYYLCLEVGAVPIEVHPHFAANECLRVGVLVVLGRAPDAHRRSRGPATGKRPSARLDVWVRVRVYHLDRAPAKMMIFFKRFLVSAKREVGQENQHAWAPPQECNAWHAGGSGHANFTLRAELGPLRGRFLLSAPPTVRALLRLHEATEMPTRVTMTNLPSPTRFKIDKARFWEEEGEKDMDFPVSLLTLQYAVSHASHASNTFIHLSH